MRAVITITTALVVAASAGAGIDPLSGIDFVHITDPGNAPWPGNGTAGDRAVGRGSVGYDYHIGRMEVNTAQWVEFFNAAFDRPDPLPWIVAPDFWGAAGATPTTPGGQPWQVPPGNENRPVGDISWRMAAMYCNWLHNGKSMDRAAFMDGAYDVSTFGTPPTQPGFSDQPTHHPDARYWIPTWDEWLKAAHYDPDKNGGQGGWWEYSNSSDTPPVGGPPGIGDANFGWDGTDYPGQSPFAVLLGAYPDVQSPWGLLDVAGGTSEWTEEILTNSEGFNFRVFEGSRWNSSPGHFVADHIGVAGADFPQIPILNFGFRIASSIPAPGIATSFGLLAAMTLLRPLRRRG